MDAMQKVKVTNANQFQKLVDELEKNPSLAKGFPCNFKEQWEDRAKNLNSLGPPIRTGDGWQVWRDLKFKVKKKMATNKAERMATGGGSFKQFIASPLEEAVANLLDFQKQLNPEGQFQGVPSASEDNEVQRPALEADISNIDEWWTDDSIPNIQLSQSAHGESVQQTSSRGQQDMPGPTKQKRKFNAVKDLEHSEEQAKHLTVISNTLTSIKQSVRDGIRYQKKLLELEERKLKILEEKNKREKEVHESEMRIKRLKTAINEKELKLFQERED